MKPAAEQASCFPFVGKAARLFRQAKRLSLAITAVVLWRMRGGGAYAYLSADPRFPIPHKGFEAFPPSCEYHGSSTIQGGDILDNIIAKKGGPVVKPCPCKDPCLRAVDEYPYCRYCYDPCLHVLKEYPYCRYCMK